MPSFTFTLVGATFRPREAKDAIRNLGKGDQLRLEREPTNAYDENAVKVIDLISGLFIGYVPKGEAPAISALLASGASANAVVQEIYSKEEGGDELKPKIHVVIED